MTFPITAPAALSIARVRFVPRSVVAVSRSPFTGQEQVYVHQGQWWEMDVDVVPGVRADMEAIVSFLLELNGQEGTFNFGPPGGAAPRGAATGTPIIASSAQSGSIFVTAGWTASLNNILRAGDWFNTGSGSSAKLYKNLKDVGTNSGGVASLTCWPKIRQAPPNSGASLSVNSAMGIWRLASNEMTWDISNAVVYGISFSCVEALNP